MDKSPVFELTAKLNFLVQPACFKPAKEDGQEKCAEGHEEAFGKEIKGGEPVAETKNVFDRRVSAQGIKGNQGTAGGRDGRKDEGDPCASQRLAFGLHEVLHRRNGAFHHAHGRGQSRNKDQEVKDKAEERAPNAHFVKDRLQGHKEQTRTAARFETVGKDGR